MEVDINASYLTSSLELIEDMQSKLPLNDSELKDYQSKGYALLKKLEWIEQDKSSLSLANESNIQNLQAPAIRRRIISDYLIKEKPTWLRLLRYRRDIFLKRLPEGFKQCLIEANLYDEKHYDWWDYLRSFAFSETEKRRIQIGRDAESKSVSYEKNRLNRPVDWVALKKENLGYDIESFKNKRTEQKLTIEVKGSEKEISEAEFFITKGEWNYAKESSEQHQFHIWLLSEDKLAILDVKDLISHIPENRGKGTWENAKIKFSLFNRKFKKTEIKV